MLFQLLHQVRALQSLEIGQGGRFLSGEEHIQVLANRGRRPTSHQRPGHPTSITINIVSKECTALLPLLSLFHQVSDVSF